MKWQKLILEAIKKHQQLLITYDGKNRKVAPHIFGFSRTGHLLLSTFQFKNYDEPETGPEWRSFDLNKVTKMKLLSEKFKNDDRYNPDDKNFVDVIARA